MPRMRVVMLGSKVGTNDTAAQLPAAVDAHRERFVRLTARDLTMKACLASS
jgi:hypothetical protein